MPQSRRSDEDDSSLETSTTTAASAQDPATALSENPLAGGFAFNLSVPPITVRMVDATGLTDYEIWLFVASAAFSGMVGFAVSFFQSVADNDPKVDVSSGVFSLLCLVLFVTFFARAIWLRRNMRAVSQTYRMSADPITPADRRLQHHQQG